MDIFLEKINNEKDIIKICDLFDNERLKFNRGMLYIFDVVDNLALEDYRNRSISGYSITGISNYNESFLLDTRFPAKEARFIEYSRSINFDLNIINYLTNVVKGRELDDMTYFFILFKVLERKRIQFKYVYSTN